MLRLRKWKVFKTRQNLVSRREKWAFGSLVVQFFMRCHTYGFALGLVMQSRCVTNGLGDWFSHARSPMNNTHAPSAFAFTSSNNLGASRPICVSAQA